MRGPNYLSPTVAEEARGIARQLLREEEAENVYWRGTDLSACFANGMFDDDNAPGGLYVVWAVLGDMWELHPERRIEAIRLTEDAAREFLAIDDLAVELGTYITRWEKQLGIGRSGLSRKLRRIRRGRDR